MPDNRDWVPDEAVEALTVRRALQEVEDPVRLATDIIKEALPLATMRMAHLAVHSTTEAIALQAARYIMDRAFGSDKGMALPDAAPAWDKIFDSVLVEVDKARNDD